MQPLNFSRQCKKSILSQKIDNRQHYLSLIDNSVKFSLPKNGWILKDKEYKALSGLEEVRLPYPCVALEYEFYQPEIPKVIVFAKEVLWEGSRYIAQTSAVYSASHKMWIFFPEVYVPTMDTFGPDGFAGWRSVAIRPSLNALEEMRRGLSKEHFAREIRVVLDFLNALACSNTEIENIGRRKRNKSAKSRALPFDEYHCLVLRRESCDHSAGKSAQGDRRGPREHIRRGHVRRYKSGKCTWVNSTIVAAGCGGRVDKDYAIA